MAEHFRFFNSAGDDVREYLASEFAEYFNRFLSDGLYTENGKAGLRVSPGTDLQVQVAPGYAFIRGYMYHNDSALTKTLDPADTMLDRIDRVVLKLDEVAREIRVSIKKGAFSSTPSPPGIEVTDTVKEMALAQVRVNAKATALREENIIDERFTEHCGLVELLTEIPLNDLIEQWNEWFEKRQIEAGVRVFSGKTESENMIAGDLWFRELGD